MSKVLLCVDPVWWKVWQMRLFGTFRLPADFQWALFAAFPWNSKRSLWLDRRHNPCNEQMHISLKYPTRNRSSSMQTKQSKMHNGLILEKWLSIRKLWSHPSFFFSCKIWGNFWPLKKGHYIAASTYIESALLMTSFRPASYCTRNISRFISSSITDCIAPKE